MSAVERTARVADTFCDLILDRQPIRHVEGYPISTDISQGNNARSIKRTKWTTDSFRYTVTRSMARLLNAIIYPTMYLRG